MPNSIQIPKFEAPAALPPEAVTAPDAPMADNGQRPPVVGSPDATPGAGDFLSGVRESNAKLGAKPADKAPPVQDTPPADPAPKPAEPSKHDTTPKVFKDAGGEKPADDAPADDSDDSDAGDDQPDDFKDPLEADPAVKPTKAKSIKDLKTQLKVVRTRETQLRTRVEELESENQRLSGFQEKMQEHEQLKERVQQLETYEQIFDIHNNPQFHEKYVEGAQTILEEAKLVAQQYGIKDPKIIDQAVKIRNRKDLNVFLQRNGLDEFGVGDIRPYIFHLQSLEDERAQLEKSPEEAREVLGKMYRESEDRRVREVSKSIHDRSANAWNQITGYYSRGENAVDAFKEKPGDPEHTERRNTVLGRANGEYVKLMGAFTGLGLRDLPPAIATALAARFQLSEWTGEFISENKSLKAQVTDLQKQLNEATKYSRPAFNGSRGSDPAPAELPKGTDVASHVFNKARDTVNARPAR